MDKIFWPVMIGMLLWFVMFGSGCSMLLNPPAPEIKTPTTILYETIEKTNWMVTFGILGMAASVGIFLNGKVTMAVTTFAVSCSMLFLTLMTQRYAVWIAFSGFVCVFGLFVYVIYTKHKAFTEVVESIDIFKGHERGSGREQPVTTLNEVLSEGESKSTARLVKEVRNA